MTNTPTYTAKDWPHGLICAECNREFVEGQTICEQLLSMFDDGTPVVLIVCAECDLGLEMSAW